MAEPSKRPDRDEPLQWIHALEARQEATEGKVDDLARSFDRFASEIRGALGRVTSTDWRSLAAWAGVIVTMVAIGGAGFVRDLAKVEDVLIGTRDREIVDAETRGRRAAELEALRHDVGVLDVTLQREMRLLDDRALSGIGALEGTIRRELDLVTGALRDRIETLERGATPAGSP